MLSKLIAVKLSEVLYHLKRAEFYLLLGQPWKLINLESCFFSLQCPFNGEVSSREPFLTIAHIFHLLHFSPQEPSRALRTPAPWFLFLLHSSYRATLTNHSQAASWSSQTSAWSKNLQKHWEWACCFSATCLSALFCVVVSIICIIMVPGDHAFKCCLLQSMQRSFIFLSTGVSVSWPLCFLSVP